MERICFEAQLCINISKFKRIRKGKMYIYHPTLCTGLQMQFPGQNMGAANLQGGMAAPVFQPSCIPTSAPGQYRQAPPSWGLPVIFM